MEKLTSVVAVLEQPASVPTVLHKAVDLARRFDARVELLLIEPQSIDEILPQCAALGYPEITVRCAAGVGYSRDTVILRHVRERRADLLIKARHGKHPLRPYSLAVNDWHLLHECPVPLMLVDANPWAKP